MEEFYSGGEHKSINKRRNTINLKKLSKAPMNTVDRLTGEGGKIFDLDVAYAEQFNKLLTS